MKPVLILRPEPGAARSAGRALSLGLTPVVAPLFTIRPLAWTAPAAEAFEAVLLTSANAPRLAGDGLASYLGLPCYCVGEATAEAARQAGFADLHVGPADLAALLPVIEKAVSGTVLHLCGREHLVPAAGRVAISSVPVYAAEPVSEFPEAARAALAAGAPALLHSPRAAALFARLVGPERSGIRIAAISEAAASAAGTGWARTAVASRPRDEALLELAAELCQSERDKRGAGG